MTLAPELRRRSFITGLVALVAAPAVVKAASLMKVAPTEVIRPETYQALDQITRHAVQMFRNNNAFRRAIYEQYRKDWEFVNGQQWDGVQGAKIGSQLRIRLPADYTVTDGPALLMGRGYDSVWVDEIATSPVEHRSGLVPSLLKRQAEINQAHVVDPALSAVALAMAAPVVIAKVLEQPVTRRFWGLPQHSAADQEG